MDIKLELTGEQINQEIVKAIAASAIGVELEKHIKATIQSWSVSYKNPIEAIISEAIRKEIHKLLTTVFAEEIRAAVTEKVTSEVIANILDASFKALMEQIDKVSRGY